MVSVANDAKPSMVYSYVGEARGGNGLTGEVGVTWYNLFPMIEALGTTIFAPISQLPSGR